LMIYFNLHFLRLFTIQGVEKFVGYGIVIHGQWAKQLHVHW